LFILSVAPVALHKIGAIRCHRSKEALCAKVSGRSAPSHRILSFHAQLHMQDPQQEKSGHGIIQHLAICAIQLCNCCEREGEWNALEEVVVCAAVEEEGIRVVVGG